MMTEASVFALITWGIMDDSERFCDQSYRMTGIPKGGAL
jgi:hypothetical protein